MRTESRELLAVGIFGGKSRGFKSNLGDRIEMLLRRGRTFSPRASSSGVVASAFVLSALTLAGSLAPRWIAFAEQQPPRAFDIASIKPDHTGTDGSGLNIAHGRLTATNVTLKDLIQDAFNIRDFQIAGAPKWLGKETYDVAAKADGPGEIEELRPLLQALLAERFKFKFHRETKELSVFSMLVAGNGPKLTGYTGGGSPSTWGITTNTSSGPGRASMRASKATMANLANVLSRLLGRTVSDNTGLKGEFDFKLEWAPDQSEVEASSGPSLFTALREQLGLKLEAAKGPVEILVIDHAEKPDAN